MLIPNNDIDALCRSSERLWFPGLARQLVLSSRSAARRIPADLYGTHRWLLEDPSANLISCGSFELGNRTTQIELLPRSSADLFPHLIFESAPGYRDIDTLTAAACLLARTPHLIESIGWLVRSLHVLRTEEGYDTSHSDPSIPFSIFVSLPSPGERDVDLRVAESILHEAMHLQLSLMEDVVPMVARPSEGFSPWQGRMRPVQGLLHGLYVFAVIRQFMMDIAASDEGRAPSARRRCREIDEEVACLDDFSPALTDGGAALRSACLGVTFPNAVRQI